MKRLKICGVLCAMALLAALPAGAKNKHSKPAMHSPKAAAEVAPAVPPGEPSHLRSGLVAWQFSDLERARIREYAQDYGDNGHGKSRSLPPGLAKKVARGEQLPPGWQKKCVAGQTLPPEIFEQCHPLPPELVVKLPPAPEPTITVAIGGKVVRLLQATREILDVFDVHVRF